MDNLINNSIESRIDCIYNSYEIEDEEIKDEIIDIKNRLYSLGKTCMDVGEFETKLAGSSLNQDYINLFTKLGTSCKVKDSKEYKEDTLLDEIGEELSYQVRKRVKQETYDEARDIPIVGEILTAKQHVDFLNKFRRKNR